MRTINLFVVATLPLAMGLLKLSVGQDADGAAGPATAHTAPPLAPAEALKQFRLHPGLKIELVACEPAVQSPVAMAFDEAGRLFVVEMHDYPNGPRPGQPPEGRIVQLFDRDRDGVYESSAVFADGLLYGNGLLPWKGGFIVTCAPHILYLKDTNGNGKADLREVWYEGFAAENPQLRVSHPILGPDGWVYVANGLRGDKVVRAGKKDAVPVDLSGMDFRFDPNDLDRYEAISGLGQYGNTFDDWGNRFVCDNRHHLRHIVMENRYLKRNPHLAARAVVQDISILEDGLANSGGKIYPLSKNWTTSNLHAGRFTAACGVFIYRDGKLGKEHEGAAFTCDPTGNLVHEEVLTPHGATFRSRPLRDGVEFLASPDDWFRPVFLSSGPDGALYVVDMYRAVIEHPQFMPEELKNRPDLLLGKERGRVWRISPSRAEVPLKSVLRTNPSNAELAADLAHPQAWVRTTAQRLLLERHDPAAVPVLEKTLATQAAVARVHAAWLLERTGALKDAALFNLLRDPDPQVRVHALRLAEPRLRAGGDLAKEISLRATDPSPQVRYQAALTLGEWGHADRTGRLVELAGLGVEDPWLRLAIQSSLSDREASFLAAYLSAAAKAVDEQKLAEAGSLALVRELCTIVGARQVPTEFAQVLENLSALETKGAASWQRAGLLGLTEGLTRRGNRLETLLARLSAAERAKLQPRLDALFQAAVSLAVDAKAPTEWRVESTQLLAHAEWGKARPVLQQLLASEAGPVEIRLAAVRSLAAHSHTDVPGILLADWKKHTPAVRREIAEAMTRSLDRTRVLLRRVEAGEITPGELDPLRVRHLLNHRDKTVQALAQKLFRDNLPAERKQVLAQYQPAVEREGDVRRGLEVFKKQCAACHRVADVGVNVAPDISDTRTKTRAQLLLDILNPNAAIDNNYVNYIVMTRNGQLFSGILGAESASSITLRRAENQSDVILRADIQEMQSTGQSLMPEGLEKDITVEQMADLLTFLKNWRYMANGPPTK